MSLPASSIPAETPIMVAAFYLFTPLADYTALRVAYKQHMVEAGIKGTILLAPEGINGTISGGRQEMADFLTFLRNDPRLSALEHKESFFHTHPFGRAKVKLKKEIISLGVPADPTENAGIYVEPEDWNALISAPDMVVVDARNEYETHLGTFKGSLDPKTRNFKQLPAYTKKVLDPKKNKRVATFCTGGIRCEKYTAYLLEQGFEEVYHLRGGILKYLETIPKTESLWEGDCYVFDDRVGVGHELVPSATATNCPSCGHSLLPIDRTQLNSSNGTRCPYCPTEKGA